MNKYGLMVDLDRCVGCYSCEVGCKEWHNQSNDTKWIRVKTLGPYKVDGKLIMDFFPEVSEGCNLCSLSVQQGLSPFCAQICPTRAIQLYTNEEMVMLLNSGKRFQICKIAYV